jgi:hypothetical protein
MMKIYFDCDNIGSYTSLTVLAVIFLEIPRSLTMGEKGVEGRDNDYIQFVMDINNGCFQIKSSIFSRHKFFSPTVQFHGLESDFGRDNKNPQNVTLRARVVESK